MKGSLFGRWMYIVCALAGCATGILVFHSAGTKEIEYHKITKDNTLLRESEDSVFFDVKDEVVLTCVPTEAPAPAEELAPTEDLASEERFALTESSIDVERPVSTEVFIPKEAPVQPTITSVPEEMPSLASQWIAQELPKVMPSQSPVEYAAYEEQEVQQTTREVITYPVEIFGQVPVINRSDEYVSYFEFTYDLVTSLEQEVAERGLNLTALMAKFAVKALFYGVDIEKLDINAPIPRREAALTLWLAAGLLGEKGSDTSNKTAQNYVTDINTCSSAEKKAVAYLYEQGIVSGYNTPGQKFYPDAKVKTETGTSWLRSAKQCWKQP